MIARERQIALMAEAIAEAQRGAAEGEVPVGAVVITRGADGTSDVIVAAAHNRPIALNDPTAHAEMLALRETASGLDLDTLKAAIDRIVSASTIVLYGVGASGLGADDLAHNALPGGLRATMVCV